MYKKLLLFAGGGIIPRSQQSEQENVATIAIGLGGTGIKCLSELKNEVYNKIKPDADSDIAEYKHIKFLAIDSDSSSIKTDSIYSIDKDSEFFDIGCSDINALISQVKSLHNNLELDWLNPYINIVSTQSGSGGIRQIGRLLFLQRSKNFVEKLTDVINSARSDLPSNADLNIHIFTGMGGGTGSGIFLDVCYLVKFVLDELQLKNQPTVCGFFFLPDINFAEISSTHVRDYIKANSFAAMKELDYCMNFSKNGREWEQQYDGIMYRSNEQPVDLSFLISATDVNGRMFDDSMNHATHTVINFVFEYIIRSYGSSQPSLKTFSYTCNNYMRMAPKEYGACYNYCVLGSANAYLPYKEITTYLVSKIFEKFEYVKDIVPSDEDVKDFVVMNGLEYENILRDLHCQLPSVPLYSVDTKTLKGECEGITPDTFPQVLSQMRDSIPKIACVLETNKKNLTNGAENTLVENSNSISSLISRVKKSLIQITSDPAKGPYYAVALLHSSATKDIQDIINGYIVENEQRLAYARADLELKEQIMANTLREFQNANSLNRNSRGKAYVSAVHVYFIQIAKINTLVVLGDILEIFKMQLEDLYNEFFKKLIFTLDNLYATFSGNLRFLSDSNYDINPNPKHIVTVSKLKQHLNKSIDEMKIQDILHYFMCSLVENEKVWILHDENKISTVVTKFFLSEFDVFTNKTIIDYLQIRFKTTDPNLLKNEIYNKIIIPAYYDASLLFWIDPNRYNRYDSAKISHSLVSVCSPVIQSAVGMINSNDLIYVDDCNGISIVQCSAGVPLFAYKGVSLYYDCYNKHKLAGLHICEGYGNDKKDFRKLPDIVPISFLSKDELTETQKSDLCEYDYAIENGIFIFGEYVDDSYINIFDEEIINSLENSVDNLNNYVNMPDSPEIIEKIFVPNDGSIGYQEIVCKDHILNSLYFMELIRKQNNLIRRYNSIKEKLKSL